MSQDPVDTVTVPLAALEALAKEARKDRELVNIEYGGGNVGERDPDFEALVEALGVPGL